MAINALAMPIPLVVEDSKQELAQQISRQWGFKIRQPKDSDRYIFQLSKGRLQLRDYDKPKLGAVNVDFISGANAYRRKYGGGRKQAIAKAVGIKKGITPNIVDATSGLGRDAFVLASLGCRVHMIERSTVIAALLDDGLNRAKMDPEIGPWITERMSLMVQDSRSALLNLPFQPHVIYLDPMYPEKKKPALVKKEMRIVQSLLGHDLDADDLFNVALKTTRERVVVKRPAYAGWLARRAPNTSIHTKKNRFDIYLSDH